MSTSAPPPPPPSNNMASSKVETEMRDPSSVSGSVTVIDSSNIGYQLLKKHGWKEGTGLGISEQGRLEPIEAHLKTNKRGLGADRVKKKILRPSNSSSSSQKKSDEQPSTKKSKATSKKMRKMQELEERLKEREFERAFFREFWPDNV